jgi:hypothetical protein
MAIAASNTNQKTLLISLLVVLAIMRFIGVPFIDYQAQQITQLNLTSQQLERAIRLLETDISDERILQVSDSLREYEGELLQHTEANTFRLQAQRAIQQAVSDYSVQLELFDWLGSEQRQQGYLEVHQARIVLQGTSQDVAQAQQATQKLVGGVKVLQFALQEQRTSARRKDVARLTLLIEIAGVRP